MNVNPANLVTLFTGFQTAFQAGFGQAPTDHQNLVLEVPSMTAVEEYGWLGEDDSLREWLGERTLRSVKAHGYSIRNRKFERTIQVSVDDIEDDKFGVYAPRFQRLGMAAARHPCELTFEALKNGFTEVCYDGQYFFDTDHPVGDDGTVQGNSGGGAGEPWYLVDANAMVKPIIFQKRKEYQLTRMDAATDEMMFMRDEARYGVSGRCNVGYGFWQTIYGSKAGLTAANYEAAFRAMLGFKNDAGVPMGIKPTHLYCGPANRGKALKILNAEFINQGESNVNKDTAELVISPWITA